MAKKICFIVGHGKSKNGGYDSGAVSGSYHEFKIAREIAKYATLYYNEHYSERAELMNYDGNLYLTERVKAVNKDSYDFIAEIHLNAGGGTGSEAFYYNGSALSEKYAEAISKSIANVFGIRNRGAKVKLGKNGKDYFGIIRDTKPCAVLVETVFIDTASDLYKVMNADGQKKCGEAIAKAVAEVRGLTEKKTSVEVVKPIATTSKYFPAYTGEKISFADALREIGYDGSYASRKKIAKANGITAFIGLASQNTKLFKLFKSGKLIKP